MNVDRRASVKQNINNKYINILIENYIKSISTHLQCVFVADAHVAGPRRPTRLRVHVQLQAQLLMAFLHLVQFDLDMAGRNS